MSKTYSTPTIVASGNVANETLTQATGFFTDVPSTPLLPRKTSI